MDTLRGTSCGAVASASPRPRAFLHADPRPPRSLARGALLARRAVPRRPPCSARHAPCRACAALPRRAVPARRAVRAAPCAPCRARRAVLAPRLLPRRAVPPRRACAATAPVPCAPRRDRSRRAMPCAPCVAVPCPRRARSRAAPARRPRPLGPRSGLASERRAAQGGDATLSPHRRQGCITPPGTKRAARWAALSRSGARRARTVDLVTASHALSQLSYSPTGWLQSIANRSSFLRDRETGRALQGIVRVGR